jgi:hypothetical protein
VASFACGDAVTPLWLRRIGFALSVGARSGGVVSTLNEVETGGASLLPFESTLAA